MINFVACSDSILVTIHSSNKEAKEYEADESSEESVLYEKLEWLKESKAIKSCDAAESLRVHGYSALISETDGEASEWSELELLLIMFLAIW